MSATRYPKATQLGQTPNNGGRFAIGQPSMIVMHYTAAGSGKNSADYLFRPHKPSSSAHFVVDRDRTTYQLSDLNRITWHAGISSWRDQRGRAISGINKYAIGIEIANYGWWRPEIAKSVPDPKAAGWLRAPHHKGAPVQWWEPFPDVQMKAVAELTEWLLREYPNIWTEVGHDMIAPGRKSDPGPAFPWEIIREAHNRVRHPTVAGHSLRGAVATAIDEPLARTTLLNAAQPNVPEDERPFNVTEDLSRDAPRGEAVVVDVPFWKSSFFYGLLTSVVLKGLALLFNVTPESMGWTTAQVGQMVSGLALLGSFIGDLIMTRGRLNAVDPQTGVAHNLTLGKNVATDV